MCDWKRALALGFIMWLVPFVVSFMLYSRDGKMLVSQAFFDSVMIFTGSLVGAVCVVRYFRRVRSDFAKEGLIVGAIWLVENWALDIAILLPMSKMALGDYFMNIGLGYFAMFFTAAAVGFSAEYVKTGWKGISEAVQKKPEPKSRRY